ncbi:MAG: DNA methyltransferase [Polyangiaceae bacterium]
MLEVARTLTYEEIAGTVSCVYVDPPYASQADYVHEARLDGGATGRTKRALAYEDSWSPQAYLDMLAPRLEALVHLLSPRGTIWVQVDWRASHFVRLLLDEILGPQRFLNEIVWKRAPNLGRQAASSQFGRTLDTLVVYGKKEAKLTPPTRLERIDEKAIRWDDQGRPSTLAPRGDYTDISVARLEKEGRIHRTATGKVYIKYFLVKDDAGHWCRERRVDALWTDIAPLRHAKLGERTGYPTQKPRALLERVILASTQPGDLVVDLFSGSGTTADAARMLGRRSIAGDRSPVAIANARARLLRSGASPSIETCDGNALPEHDANVTVMRMSERGLRIVLDAPDEPLAWTVGIVEDGALRRAWHTERTPGAQAVPAERTIEIDHDPKSTLGIRVYEDDGRATTIEVPSRDLPARGRSASFSSNRNRGKNK